MKQQIVTTLIELYKDYKATTSNAGMEDFEAFMWYLQHNQDRLTKE